MTMKIKKYFFLLICMLISFNMRMIAYAQSTMPDETSSIEETESESTTDVPTTEESTEETTETKIVTLTFYYYEGCVFETISGENGLGLTNSIPTREGYEFLYWQYEENGKMVIASGGQIFTEDTDFYAFWDPRLTMPPEYFESVKKSKEERELAEKVSVMRDYATIIRRKKPTISVKGKKNKTVAVSVNAAKFKKDGFKIQYSTSKKFKNAKTITVKSTKKKLSTKIRKLKKNKTYYIRVRAYTIFDPSKYGSDDPVETFYSKWSKTKKVKTMK